jgi:hypothetical protein
VDYNQGLAVDQDNRDLVAGIAAVHSDFADALVLGSVDDFLGHKGSPVGAADKGYRVAGFDWVDWDLKQAGSGGMDIADL